MIVLALDTSCSITTAALCDDARVLAASEVPPPRKAGELLPGLLEELCQSAGLRLRDVAGLAVGLGPGSFTGLRVGLAAAKGLAYALRVPVAGCSSLAALAHAAGVHGMGAGVGIGVGVRVGVPALEARRGELFVALPSQGEVVLRAPELATWLLAHPDATAFGAGIPANRPALVAAGVPESQLLAAPLAPPGPSIAALCLPALHGAAYDAAALFALSPQYLSQSEPEKALAEGRVGKLPK